jgi:hypothetical protein
MTGNWVNVRGSVLVPKIIWLKDDDFAKSHQRAPSGAPRSMTGSVSH